MDKETEEYLILAMQDTLFKLHQDYQAARVIANDAQKRADSTKQTVNHLLKKIRAVAGYLNEHTDQDDWLTQLKIPEEEKDV